VGVILAADLERGQVTTRPGEAPLWPGVSSEILDRNDFPAYRSPSRKAVWPSRQLRLTLPCSAGSIERCRASRLLLSLCPLDLARPVPADCRLIACCQGV